MGGRKNVKVLLDTRAKNLSQNPYLSELVDHTAPGAELRGFSWTEALLGSYDVLHAHWPEYMVDYPDLRRRTAARCLMVLLLARLALTRTPVIVTRHNDRARVSRGPIDVWLLRAFERRVRGEVSLRRSGSRTEEVRSHVVIPHSDYLPWAERLGHTPSAVPIDGYVLGFGILRRYKNFDTLLQVTEDCHVVIAGAIADEEYASTLRSVASVRRASADLRFGRVSDEETLHLFDRARLVAIPYPDPGNSGVALLALSLGRPVLMERNAASQELQADYGPEWVHLYDPPFAAASFKHALGALPKSPVPVPVRRRWPTAGEAHTSFYRQVLIENSRR